MTPRPARNAENLDGGDVGPDDGDLDGASVDAMIEQVLARTPHPIDWTRLSASHAAQTWLDLDDWIRWLVRTYALDHRDVPPCWYHHGDLVEELTALWTAHRAAYETTGSATGPAEWHHTFAACRSRLQLGAARTGCRHDQHRALTPPAWAADPAPGGYAAPFLDHVDDDTAGRRE